MENKTTYYYIPADDHGQPGCNICYLNLTPEEYTAMKQAGHYIYDDYARALARIYN